MGDDAVGDDATLGRGLTVLVVDDEAPTRDEVAWLLGQDERVGAVHLAANGTDALRALESQAIDVIFSDINMPGFDGIELARIIARFADRPAVVFVTAYDEHAVDAFALAATDYVMKPVRADRLREAVRRAVAARDARMPVASDRGAAATSGGSGGWAGNGQSGRDDRGATLAAAAAGSPDETIPVELGGVTRFVQRSEIRYALAAGDYARLHTATASHLVRIPLATLEQRWEEAGFVRIHRSTLVSTAHVDEVRVEHGRCTVVVDGVQLQVSRRHTRALRDRLVRTRRQG